MCISLSISIISLIFYIAVICQRDLLVIYISKTTTCTVQSSMANRMDMTPPCIFNFTSPDSEHQVRPSGDLKKVSMQDGREPWMVRGDRSK